MALGLGDGTEVKTFTFHFADPVFISDLTYGPLITVSDHFQPKVDPVFYSVLLL